MLLSERRAGIWSEACLRFGMDTPAAPPNGLVYGLNDRMPAGTALLVSLQQVSAMVVGVITPALLLSNILKFSPGDTAYLTSMALVAASIGTFLQSTRIGPIGSGLLSVTGTSFAFIQPLVAAGQAGGLALMFGMSLAAAPVTLVLAPFLPRLRRFFSPLVCGIVVLLIGLSIIPEAMYGIVASPGAGAPAWAGAAVAACVIAAVVAAQAAGQPWTRLAGILFGVVAGYLVCGIFGWLHAPPPSEGGWVSLPRFLPHGAAFKWDYFLPFAFIYVVSVMESLGDMTATAQLSGLETRGREHSLRMRAGIYADGVTTIISALIGSFPSTTYAQNNGVIQITGVASRHIGRWMAAILMLLGIFPIVSRWVTAMPPSVLGGLALMLFGLVSVAGLRLISQAGLTHRNALVVAIALAIGIGAPSQTQWLGTLPAVLRSILESGVSAGGIAALLLNFILPGGHEAPMAFGSD
jgi:xanthine permease XanP